MPQTNEIYHGQNLIKQLACEISRETADSINERYGGKGILKIFADGGLMNTCLCLFENDLNVSATAGKLYMHRNTLLYGINKIKRLSGLDVRKFSDAVTFLVLYNIHERAKSGSAEGI